MENVPKIVRERLGARMPAGAHPDADVLTAFAECSLPQLERSAVLEHLARCGDCRDVLALALPEAEVTQTVIAPTRSGWLTRPVLRWGFVAAGGVAIISLGILQYQRHLHSVTMVARQTTNAQTVASNVQPQPAPPPVAVIAKQEEKAVIAAPSSADISGAASTESSQDRLTARTEMPPASLRKQRSSGGVVAGVGGSQLLHGPGIPTQWQQQQVGRMQAAPAPPSAGAMRKSTDLAESKQIPQSSQTVQVETSSQTPINAETQNRPLIQDQDSQIQAPSSQPAQEFEYPSRAIGKAKPAANAQAANAAPRQVVGGPLVQSSNGLRLAQLSTAVPRWTISSAGGLQRSFDQGQTWQDVDVNAGPTPVASRTSLAVVATTARAKDAVADKKVPQGLAGPLVFRAVTAIGLEVWAGGSSGALYHSLDAGSHWTQVVPSAKGAVLTGDIVGLEFPDAQQGKITTSTAEIWVTSDGGQTWQKQ